MELVAVVGSFVLVFDGLAFGGDAGKSAIDRTGATPQLLNRADLLLVT
jgi:hypothetical protein